MDLMSRTATWSIYKHYNTIKYLLSTTTQGTVNYTSKGCAGIVLVKCITEDCGYLSKLQAGGIVLTVMDSMWRISGLQSCNSKYSSFHKGEVTTFP